jgi:hypothetical protein
MKSGINSKYRLRRCQSFGSDPTVKKEFESRAIVKEEQARFLKVYAEDNGQSLSEGYQYKRGHF